MTREKINLPDETKNKFKSTDRDNNEPPTPHHQGYKEIDPMLATSYDGDLMSLSEDKWVGEIKYDGTRLILQKYGGHTRTWTRRGTERTKRFPQLIEEANKYLPEGTIIDGELTFVNEDGVSQFLPIHANPSTVEERGLEPRLMVFDVLYVDNESVMREPWKKRRRILEDIINDSRKDMMKLSPFNDTNFQEMFEQANITGREGLIMKNKESPYLEGSRSRHWKKVKAFNETDLIIVGYTKGEGQRSGLFGSLVMTDGEKYVGRVGTGFTNSDLKKMKKMFELRDEPKMIDKTDVPVEFQPIEPFVAEIKYQNLTNDNTLRMPVFNRIRRDKPMKDVQMI